MDDTPGCPIPADGTAAGAGAAVHVRPPSVVRLTARHEPAEQGTVPMTQPSFADTNVTAVGVNATAGDALGREEGDGLEEGDAVGPTIGEGPGVPDGAPDGAPGATDALSPAIPDGDGWAREIEVEPQPAIAATATSVPIVRMS
ncbi:MAG: hypothetical protein ACYDAK_12025 [Candidatus Limnocylindrales bacterium]